MLQCCHCGVKRSLMWLAGLWGGGFCDRLSEDDPLTQQIPTRVRSECMQTGINGPCCIHTTLP